VLGDRPAGQAPREQVDGRGQIQNSSVADGRVGDVPDVADGSGMVVHTFLRRCTPVIPSRRISRPTRSWLTTCPARRSAAVIRGRL
jgi:hypothetical protein